MSAKPRALIGSTGFVGRNLAEATPFDVMVHSPNVDDLRGGGFGEIVCAGVHAKKWLANREPEADAAAIARLTDVLATVEADRFVLISTIDVYPDPTLPLTEDEVPADLASHHAYGRHRRELELWVRERFPHAEIVRLPALFGPHLVKNALFDLLHDHETDRIDPAGVFQFYPVTRLVDDLARLRAADLQLVNLFTEPVALAEIIRRFFPDAVTGAPGEQAPRYALRSRHAELFGGADGFVMRAPDVLDAIGAWLDHERGAGA